MDETQRRVDEIRKESSELENHIIDQLIEGKITRRDFVRRGTVVGMSIPLLSFIAAACGGGNETAGTTGGGTATGAVKPGGNVRVALIQPSTAPNPVIVKDEGGAGLIGSTGEFLSFSNQKLELEPKLAEEWSPNDDGTQWTFKIRQGVKFHSGASLTANDVKTVFDTLSDPKNASNALSALGGVLSPGNTEVVDDATVVFHLDAPNGNFPTLVSSANYNAIIIPANVDPADWGKTMDGTGPFKLESFTPKVGATFVRYDGYWGEKANPDKMELKFYDNEAPMVNGIKGGDVDFVEHFSVSGGKALLDDPNIQVIAIRTATHRQLHMRTDKDPFTDKRVRQAIGLAVDRPALVDGLWDGKADLGNDSPFAPLYPSTDTSVPQRTQDLEKAKQLLSDAGKTSFTVELVTWNGFEIADLAQLVKQYGSEIGVTINLKVYGTDTEYYADAVFGKSPWLDSVMGITDYGHRPVPNVFLSSVYTSKGTWNAAHFKNAQADQLIAGYIGALDLDSQRTAAKKIQELLLDETPVVIPYFYNFLSAATPNLKNAVSAATGQFDLSKAGFTS
jgi:peptide/nickel transport system substrate-binding protein